MIQSRLVQPRLILASQSPRRAKLLGDAGYDFSQQSPLFVDPPTPTGVAGAKADVNAAVARASEHAASLAMQKARSLVSTLREPMYDYLVIGSDTILVGPDGALLGQPQTRDEAADTLQSLQGTRHHAVTGVALIDIQPGGKATSFADVAAVTLGLLDPQMLEQYLNSGDWRGKAGGYNLGELEADWPIEVEGDPTTVIGLPMGRLVQALHQLGVEPRGR